MSAIIPFDFEEHAIRIVMRGENPWFVAADVCRALDLGNAGQAVSRLDDDEKGVTSNDTLGGKQQMTIISESGLYALILTSRKPAAKRFRKWITSEVIPAIRLTGRYDPPVLAAASSPGPDAALDDHPMRENALWLSMIREARHLAGPKAARSLWDRSPLPALPTSTPAQEVTQADGLACLEALIVGSGDLIGAARRGDKTAILTLSARGLRGYRDGLFIANTHPGLSHSFSDLRWIDGDHRAALLSIAGVATVATTKTLAGVACRGILVPWAIYDASTGGLTHA